LIEVSGVLLLAATEVIPVKQVTMRVEWCHWRFFGPGGSIRQLHQEDSL